ncbi:H-2 class II histocompatibility antigen, A-Q alpha chain-like [Chanos chanos]|uniref:H-2 class II histocompatibility antigen, A-Q alpha chain-like n=1 Tax=Chanos chanos TaxID=29144 RepID=A0A6J2WRV9_CHACN|nr:H-2 class II histocompatibility antigen, A-Q alpha chain-like [Chanos chanos]
MRLCIFTCAILNALVYTGAEVKHKEIHISDCSDTKQGEDIYGLDGEEMAHADYSKKEYVMTLPDFADQFRYEDGIFDTAVTNQQVCKQNIDIWVKSYNNPTEATAPPENSIYPKDDVMLGVKNTLICYVTGFYPPALRVKWTRNNEDVTEGTTLSQFRPNDDSTFTIFSTLSFTPEQGDIYTCTVEHQALPEPLTKVWEADSEITVPSIGPSVFCGVGLTVGLLGVAVGTFFLVKGNNCS